MLANSFSEYEDGELRRRQRPIEIEAERAVARAQDLRRVEGHRAEQHAARDRPQNARGDGGAKGALDERRRPHGADADRGRDEAEPDQRAVVNEVQGRRLGRVR